jgi:hypothetical protein
MSERAEQVASALTSEWQTTAQIAGRIPASPGIMPVSHLRAIYKHLDRMERWGEAERRVVRSPAGGREAMWRSRA